MRTPMSTMFATVWLGVAVLAAAGLSGCSSSKDDGMIGGTLWSAVDRDFTGSTAQLADTAEVSSIESDGADGYRMTYTVGNESQTIHWTASDYGSRSNCSYCYYKKTDDVEYWFWDPSRYSTVPEADHFEVGAWSFDYMESGEYTNTQRGFVVYGTPTTDLPTGTATYVGRVHAESHLQDNPSRSQRVYNRGRLELTADFGASTIIGSMDQFEFRWRESNSYTSAPSTIVNIKNGTISNSQFTANLTSNTGFSGNMEGHFYGPGAAEVGGIWEGTNSTNNRVFHGYFGGDKQ